MSIDILNRLPAHAQLPEDRARMLLRILRRADCEMANVLAVLLSGSFRHSSHPFDIDLMIIFKASAGFERSVLMDRGESVKAEIFCESLDTLRHRLLDERRRNVVGLERFLLGSIDLLNPGNETMAMINTVIAEVRAQAGLPAPLSKAYVAVQFEQSLHVLLNATSRSDLISVCADVLHLLRQTYYVIQGQRADGSLKHFLRRLENDSPEFHAGLLDAVAECQGRGNAMPLKELLTHWLDEVQLIAPSWIKVGKNMVEIKPITDAGL